MANVNGFEMHMITDVILKGDTNMTTEELFGRLRAEPPIQEVGQTRTLNDLYRVISDNW